MAAGALAVGSLRALSGGATTKLMTAGEAMEAMVGKLGICALCIWIAEQARDMWTKLQR